MIATKAVAALLMTGLGSLAAGTAAYLTASTQAFVREPPHGPPPPPPPAMPLRVAPSTPRVVQAEMVSIEPFVITARPHPRQKAVAQKATPTTQGACSDWRDLATGPAGRKVRMLCP
jgi:hypothetical protein